MVPQTGRPEAACRSHHARINGKTRSEGGKVFFRAFIGRTLRRRAFVRQGLFVGRQLRLFAFGSSCMRALC